MPVNTINPYEVIAEHFWDLLDSVLNYEYTHFMLKGGRGSTKSSFIGIAIPLMMMIDAQDGIHSNAVALRKVGDTLADSVYAQLIWGIEMLGASDLWEPKVSPLKLIYKPTGQEIRFRSANNKDDHKKIKSTKFKKGFCKYVWYEELDEFFGMGEIRSINQSLLRGGSGYEVFYSFNPPKMISSWVNAEVLIVRADRLIHTSTYLNVPVEWLGEQFIIEAETLKAEDEMAYRNEYLGEATGTGGAVFTNITIREISDEEIQRFDNIADGIDFRLCCGPSELWAESFRQNKKKTVYIQ